MARRDALHRPLVSDSVIGGGHGVRFVMQGQLHLGRGELGDRSLEGQAHDVRRVPELTQEGRMVLQFREAVDLDAFGPAPGADRARRQDLSVRAPGHVDQVEFQLAGGHGSQAVGGVAVQHPAQHMAGVEVVGSAVQLVHGQHDLSDVRTQPGGQGQGPGHGSGATVSVSVLPDQAGVLAVGALGVDHQDGTREEAPIVVDRGELIDPQAFAARHAGQAREDDFDEPDLGMGGHERPAFLGTGDRIGGHGRNLGSDVSGSFATPGPVRQPPATGQEGGDLSMAIT